MIDDAPFDHRRYDSDRARLRDFKFFDAAFARFRDRAIALLELGVRRGGSLRLWRDYFPRATVAGLDCEEVPDIEGERVRVYRGRQEDTALLSRIAAECAPAGFDVIIDDASHEAAPTRASFEHLFRRHLKPGGVYVIEDWGTGYFRDWPDGHAYVEGRPHLDGMVGFVKELIDEQGRYDRSRGASDARSSEGSRFDHLVVTPHLVFVTKLAI
jgi:hypothetical protein